MESFNRFSQWIGFGNPGVIAENDPVEQEKAMKFNSLLTNAAPRHAGRGQSLLFRSRAVTFASPARRMAS
ncbi:Tn3 family transposase [Streptomyces sp. FXJ1.4098]|nr:Tn3 family transposase [Streptomyces sp. FXJ1.4098]